MNTPFRILAPIDLGTFEVNSGRIVVSDPSGDLWDSENTPHARQFNVLAGTWVASSVRFEFDWRRDRKEILCAELIATHCSSNSKSWINAGWNVSIDTGQAGFFDINAFCNDATVPNDILVRYQNEITFDNDRPWYSFCCELTVGKLAAVLDGGVVSSSGFGDGGGHLFTQNRHDGAIVGLRLVFIDENGIG